MIMKVSEGLLVSSRSSTVYPTKTASQYHKIGAEVASMGWGSV